MMQEENLTFKKENVCSYIWNKPPQLAASTSKNHKN